MLVLRHVCSSVRLLIVLTLLDCFLRAALAAPGKKDKKEKNVPPAPPKTKKDNLEEKILWAATDTRDERWIRVTQYSLDRIREMGLTQTERLVHHLKLFYDVQNSCEDRFAFSTVCARYGFQVDKPDPYGMTSGSETVPPTTPVSDTSDQDAASASCSTSQQVSTNHNPEVKQNSTNSKALSEESSDQNYALDMAYICRILENDISFGENQVLAEISEHAEEFKVMDGIQLAPPSGFCNEETNMDMSDTATQSCDVNDTNFFNQINYCVPANDLPNSSEEACGGSDSLQTDGPHIILTVVDETSLRACKMMYAVPQNMASVYEANMINSVTLQSCMEYLSSTDHIQIQSNSELLSSPVVNRIDNILNFPCETETYKFNTQNGLVVISDSLEVIMLLNTVSDDFFDRLRPTVYSIYTDNIIMGLQQNQSEEQNIPPPALPATPENHEGQIYDEINQPSPSLEHQEVQESQEIQEDQELDVTEGLREPQIKHFDDEEEYLDLINFLNFMPNHNTNPENQQQEQSKTSNSTDATHTGEGEIAPRGESLVENMRNTVDMFFENLGPE